MVGAVVVGDVVVAEALDVINEVDAVFNGVVAEDEALDVDDAITIG